jgi:hypothetical protein
MTQQILSTFPGTIGEAASSQNGAYLPAMTIEHGNIFRLRLSRAFHAWGYTAPAAIFLSRHSREQANASIAVGIATACGGSVRTSTRRAAYCLNQALTLKQDPHPSVWQ